VFKNRPGTIPELMQVINYFLVKIQMAKKFKELTIDFKKSIIFYKVSVKIRYACVRLGIKCKGTVT
jgi:hypothetical protein